MKAGNKYKIIELKHSMYWKVLVYSLISDVGSTIKVVKNGNPNKA